MTTDKNVADATGADKTGGGTGTDKGGAGDGKGAGAGAAGDKTKTGAGGAGDQGKSGGAASGAGAAGDKGATGTDKSGDDALARLLEGEGDGKAAAPADWPDDWREKAANGDAKKLEILKRYSSPIDGFNALFAARTKISQGVKASAFPDKGTPEEQAAWRKEAGIPEAPADYLKDFQMPDGLVIGDADKPTVDEYLKTMHGRNASPEVVKESLAWYFKAQEAAVTQRMERDAEIGSQTEESLRTELGNEYKPTMNVIKNYMEGLPNEVATALKQSRTSGGDPLMLQPEVIKWIASMAKVNDPIASVVSMNGRKDIDSIKEEIASIEKDMKAPNAKERGGYWKDEAKQARYRQLTTARDQHENKKRA